MTRRDLVLMAVLVLLGAGWGLNQPLAKIAVSEGYRHFGLIVWQLVIGSVLLGAILLVRGRRPRLGAPQLQVALVIAFLGTLVPNAASYQAAVHLPAGIIAILLSLVPLFAFPVALGLGIDRFSLRRLTGLVCGIAGVLLIVGPDASLPEPGMAAWIPLALIAPFFYALEGNYVERWGTAGLDPIETLFLASLIGIPIAAVAAAATGHLIDPRPPWGAPDAALLFSSVVHALVYAGYVWLVGRAGSVFAAQVSYLVTGFGVFWALALLGESYSGWAWAALALMFAGLALVQPRRLQQLADAGSAADDARRSVREAP